jgi:Family of unknown function (DUF5338)
LVSDEVKKMSESTKANALEKTLFERAKQSNNHSYVEFLANLELIKTNLEKGYTAKALWEALTEENIITVHYVTFSRYLRKQNLSRQNDKIQSGGKNTSNDLNKIKTGMLNSPPQNVQSMSHAEPLKLNLPDGMSLNPKINPKDLI